MPDDLMERVKASIKLRNMRQEPNETAAEMLGRLVTFCWATPWDWPESDWIAQVFSLLSGDDRHSLDMNRLYIKMLNDCWNHMRMRDLLRDEVPTPRRHRRRKRARDARRGGEMPTRRI